MNCYARRTCMHTYIHHRSGGGWMAVCASRICKCVRYSDHINTFIEIDSSSSVCVEVVVYPPIQIHSFHWPILWSVIDFLEYLLCLLCRSISTVVGTYEHNAGDRVRHRCAIVWVVIDSFNWQQNSIFRYSRCANWWQTETEIVSFCWFGLRTNHSGRIQTKTKKSYWVRSGLSTLIWAHFRLAGIRRLICCVVPMAQLLYRLICWANRTANDPSRVTCRWVRGPREMTPSPRDCGTEIKREKINSNEVKVKLCFVRCFRFIQFCSLSLSLAVSLLLSSFTHWNNRFSRMNATVPSGRHYIRCTADHSTKAHDETEICMPFHSYAYTYILDTDCVRCACAYTSFHSGSIFGQSNRCRKEQFFTNGSIKCNATKFVSESPTGHNRTKQKQQEP